MTNESSDSSFTISETQVIAEVGSSEVERLRWLRCWLEKGPRADWERGDWHGYSLEYRTAPSIIVRSEAELFGVSMPRFAYRAYLGDAEGSFVNARRIVTFCRSVASRLDLDPGVEFLSRLKQRCSCIADSLLVPPHWLSRFHMLTVDLGRAYGEHRSIHGTPYVMHIEFLGGGLCAQAVCFQATALWEHCAGGIFGVAEITALYDDQQVLMDLSGMTPNACVRYFENKLVSLGAHHQQFPRDARRAGHGSSQSAEERFATALRAYVASGVPVILRVDIGRMNGVGDVTGPAIFGQLPKEFRRGWNEKEKQYPHAVIVVGVESDPNRELTKTQFVINDPATMPFLIATAKQLGEARAYQLGSTGRRGLGPFDLLAVVPKEVKLPLGENSSWNEKRYGLFYIARAMQTLNPKPWVTDSTLPALPSFWERGQYQPGSFRLLNLKLIDEFRKAGPDSSRRFELQHRDELPEDAFDHLRELGKNDVRMNNWCWIQYRHHSDGKRSMWIWDAQQESFDGSHPRPYEQWLLGISVSDGPTWQPMFSTKADEPAVPPHPQDQTESSQRHSPRLRASLISSFSTRSFKVARKYWPNSSAQIACELYLAMQEDIDRRLRRIGYNSTIGGQLNAVEVMAQFSRPSGEGLLTSWLEDACQCDLPIVALATFIPEITASPESRRGKLAQQAIQFACRFAVGLKRNGQRDLRAIELVAGSRIDGIFHCQHLSGGGHRFFASKMSDDDAQTRLLANLEAAMQNVSGQLRDEGILLALELEPGPLFAVRDWSTLTSLCQRLQRNESLQDLVGVNLDVAHWKLARIEPHMLRGPEPDAKCVMACLVHSHISGHHHCAHFGDVCLDELNSKDDFLPWLRILDARTRMINEPLQFSGVVSHEFEAAKKLECVHKSVAILQDWINTMWDARG